MTTSLQSSSKDNILKYLLKKNQASVQEIAQAMDVTTQAVRRHIKELEEQNLIDYNIIHPKTGRPQYHYFLTKKGRDLFPQNYGEFAVSFLDTLAETVGENQLTKVLEKQWHKKAEIYRKYIQGNTLKMRVDKLIEIRKKEGYMAELYAVDGEQKQFFFTEHNCAISDVAESYPQVCSHELEMFASLFPDCTVERTNWIHHGEHRCGYLIQKQA